MHLVHCITVNIRFLLTLLKAVLGIVSFSALMFSISYSSLYIEVLETKMPHSECFLSVFNVRITPVYFVLSMPHK
jgi:hypothetical protein